MKLGEVAIIIPPDDSFREINTAVPSLGVAVLSNFLEKNGYRTSVTDLAREAWLNPETGKAAAVFGDSARVGRYLAGNPDGEIELAAERLLRNVRPGDGVMLAFSMDLMPSYTKYGSMLCMAKYAKDRCGCATVAGGLLYAEGLAELLRYDCIDYAVRSLDLYSFCGHYPLLRLCRALEGGETGFSDIPGLMYKDGGKLYSNQPEDAETFFPPSFQRFDTDMYRVKTPARFLSRCGDRILVLPYRFSAGCPRNCGFCYNSRFGTSRRLEAQRIVEDLGRLMSETGCRHFLFLNPCINITPAFSRDFAGAVIESGMDLAWSDCAMFEGLDEDVLELYVRAGCKRLYFGFESLTRNVKKYANKKLDLRHIGRVLNICRELSIWVGLDIITGLPGETREEMKKVAGFLVDNADTIDSVTVNEFKLYRHTGFHASPEKFGIRPRESDESSLKDAFGLPFDEIRGRTWEKICIDTKWGAQLIKAAFESTHGYSNDSEMLPLLFGLYEKMRLKDEIRPVYRELVADYSKSSSVSEPARSGPGKPEDKWPADRI